MRIAKNYNTTVVGISRVSTFGGEKITSKSAVATPEGGVIYEALHEEKLAVIEL